jgi:hypothetical protein
MGEDDDVQWQEEFKDRVSSGFDRLVAFAATELNRRSIEETNVSPKHEMQPYADYRTTNMKKEEQRKMKSERDSFHNHHHPADLRNERRMRMMFEEQNRKSSKHHYDQ